LGLCVLWASIRRGHPWPPSQGAPAAEVCLRPIEHRTPKFQVSEKSYLLSGSPRFAAIYWLSGVLGILASVLFYPEYVSSGSSQALMGLSASILILRWRKFDIQKWSLFIAGMVLILQLALDIYVNNFPKAGHVAGFIAGAILCWLFSLSKILRLSPEKEQHTFRPQTF
jgi:hypothetical protein